MFPRECPEQYGRWEPNHPFAQGILGFRGLGAYYIGIMEKKMEATIWGFGVRVYGSGCSAGIWLPAALQSVRQKGWDLFLESRWWLWHNLRYPPLNPNL